MHHLLEKQIKDNIGKNEPIPSQWDAFFEVISQTYTRFDEELTRIKSLSKSTSSGSSEKNQKLAPAEIEVVKKRTKELDKRVAELEDVRRAMTNLLEDFETEQKKLAEAKAKDEAILTSIADGCIVVNEQGKIILINHLAQKLLGFTSEEAIGKLWHEILHREDENGNPISPEHGAIQAALSTSTTTVKGKSLAVSENKTTAGIYYYLRRDKTKFPVAITVAPVVLQNKIVGAVEVFRDLTDRKKAEERLIEEKNKEEALAKDLEKFKLAVDNVSDNIIISDPAGTVIYANRAVEKVTGYKPEEAIGKKSGVLWKAPMPQEFYKKLWETIKTQKKIFHGEIQNRRKNGEIYTAIISISPILSKTGDILFFVAIERDITREKEIDRLKDEFVSIASHELRTPLTAIDGLVSMILDGEYGPTNSNLKQPLEDINISSERLIHLVNDLLDLSRIKAGRMKYTLSDFAINDIINESVHLLHPLAEQKGLQLVSMVREPILVQADCDKVKEVLNNIIGNSLKFTDRGTITVSAKKVEQTIVIYVADTGIGISKEDQVKLFGQFQQIELDKNRPPGTGLGLHISKELVINMGGDMWLEKSKLGKGSTFAFSLPLVKSAKATKAKDEIEKEAQEQPDQKSDKIER